MAKIKDELYLYVPNWLAYKYRQAQVEKMILEMAHVNGLSKSAQEDIDRQLKDTKPDFIIDDSAGVGRRVITVGAGELWREDLKDMAARTLEKPDPSKNPDLQRDLKNDLDTAVWAGKRKVKGSFSVGITKDYKENSNGTAS